MSSAKHILDRIELLATRMADGNPDAVDSAIAYATIKILVSELDSINEEEHDENEFIDEHLGEIEEHALSMAQLDDDEGYNLRQHYLWLMTSIGALRGSDCFDVEEE